MKPGTRILNAWNPLHGVPPYVRQEGHHGLGVICRVERVERVDGHLIERVDGSLIDWKLVDGCVCSLVERDFVFILIELILLFGFVRRIFRSRRRWFLCFVNIRFQCIGCRVATKIFEDFDASRTALPLKERFFLLKPNVLRHLVSIGQDNPPSAKDSQTGSPPLKKIL